MTVDDLILGVEEHRRRITARIEALRGELAESKRLLREVDRHHERLMRDRERGIHQPSLPMGEESQDGPVTS